jgi:hypothetical protein
MKLFAKSYDGGPWSKTWNENKNNKYITLTHGREEVQ